MIDKCFLFERIPFPKKGIPKSNKGDNNRWLSKLRQGI